MSIILIKWSNVLKVLSFYQGLLQCNQKEIFDIKKENKYINNFILNHVEKEARYYD